ncbi:hypothetical protein Plhal703r1_c08g0043361 [Plasmopara halstedii]
MFLPLFLCLLLLMLLLHLNHWHQKFSVSIRQELRDERDSSCRDHFTEVCKLVFGQTTSAEKSIASISKSRSGGTVLVNGGHPENKNGLQ